MILNKDKIVSCVGLIPARSGSERIHNKNIRLLGKHPLLGYSIVAALKSEVFEDVFCITDSNEYAEIANYYGSEPVELRPTSTAGKTSTDYEWVYWFLELKKQQGKIYDCFSIIRPTSPFRDEGAIKRAWSQFLTTSEVDSLRAVEKCTQHPAKMWRLKEKYMEPLIEVSSEEYPLHSKQYSSLEEIYIQNASLEIAWTKVIYKNKNISGNKIVPFFTQGYEGYDINNENDWLLAEKLISKGVVSLAKLDKLPRSQ